MRLRTVAVPAACLVLGAAGGVLVAGSTGADPATPYRAELTDLQTTEDAGYRFSDWWSDHQSVLRLSPAGDGLVLGDPFARRRLDAELPYEVPLQASDPIQPTALAALPGSRATSWVAVAMPADLDQREDDEVARGVVFVTGSAPDTPARPVELPIDTLAQRSDGGTPGIDVALATTDDDAVTALVSADQAFGTGETRATAVRGLVVCADLRDCTWEEAPLPDEGRIFGLGSTGTGYALLSVDGDTSRVWFAEAAAEPQWQLVDERPVADGYEHVQDGVDGILLTRQRETDDGAELSVDVLGRDGRIDEGATGIVDETGSVRSVARVADEWLVGRRSAPVRGVDLPYAAGRPLLLHLRDGAWEEIDDQPLVSQIDQDVVAIVDSRPAGTELVTSSAVQRTDSLWRLVRQD